ncbi:hypothetical protein A9264_09385 [Vibrio sp. UCD-FRSSP16_10]|uniref:hypothetical protein n=1 Tax=unclassified Vibrio TaxID=2614977 RepID=UPI0007FC9BDA|nr:MULTISPECIES: hypothetical protein [unclassified Vibrio]OBT16933.1 hypothetical protein A9260_09610 [Vibrio sp. UCD-FRSSP16_30]OBT21924.1 hypothetical protein A9264_09385 [Vibrio sp. UCD-FRSSP16_10]
MARITNAQRETNLQEVNNAIFECFIEGGVKNVTMINVAMRWGRQYASAVQPYYKSDELLNGLRGKVMPYFTKFVDLRKIQTPEQLEIAWELGLKDGGFCNIISLFVSHAISNSNETHNLASAGLLRLTQAVYEALGTDGLNMLERMMGRSAIKSCLSVEDYREHYPK